ncbi:hypothetical protein ASPFODRAFT_630812 [Aspergillus luchuensis CBS 106.47]|uniref:Uncharacterized protein n=1 Tax=Aspergillus luchuensis (strain CBS 106.47) TaxID=1137211 RepID=A0A1M3TGK9_ASPLC|nr:hypothetical protein ASPFODRAFT_630812 [Aspergillus luchuensis CBS 106.47]
MKPGTNMVFERPLEGLTAICILTNQHDEGPSKPKVTFRITEQIQIAQCPRDYGRRTIHDWIHCRQFHQRSSFALRFVSHLDRIHFGPSQPKIPESLPIFRLRVIVHLTVNRDPYSGAFQSCRVLSESHYFPQRINSFNLISYDCLLDNA